MAGYLFFQYINNTPDFILEETLKMKNRKNLEITYPFDNSD